MADTEIDGEVEDVRDPVETPEASKKTIGSQMRLLLSKLSLWQKASLAAVAVTIVIGIIWLVTWSSRPEYALLFGDLPPEDASAIVQQLKAEEIPYRLSAGGTRIEVGEDDVKELRLSLVGQGLPSGGRGKGFELFDELKLGTTDFVENLNYVRALESELAGTIVRFKEVNQSRVHLVIPKRTLYWEQEKKPTASVWVKLRRGADLGREHVKAIAHLVAGAVEGLTPKNVTVVDSAGEILTYGEENPTTQLTADQLKARSQAEKSFENKIVSLLQPIVGDGKVRARVSVLLDFKEVSRQEELYEPTDKVIRSEQELQEESLNPNAEGGIPGTKSNIPGSETEAADEAGTPQKYFKRTQRTRNYEVGKTVRTVLERPGNITRVSAAVILDDKMSVQEGEEGPEYEYQPRTEEEIAKCTDVVKKAIGFSEDRGDTVVVQNMSFDHTQVEQERLAAVVQRRDAMWSRLLEAIRTPLIILSAILVFIFVIRPLMKGVIIREDAMALKPAPAMAGIAGAEAAAELGAGEVEPGAIEGKTIDEIESEMFGDLAPSERITKREVLIKRINGLVDSDLDGVVALVRTWLTEGRR